MASVHDVAAYLCEKQRGDITALKLQKLLYYALAWCWVINNYPLFPGRIEAWIDGPVQPEIVPDHFRKVKVPRWHKGDPEKLSYNEKLIVDAIMAEYGDKSPEELRDLTHKERPWVDARAGLKPRERSNNEITRQAMVSFHSQQLDARRRIQSHMMARQIDDLSMQIAELAKRRPATGSTPQIDQQIHDLEMFLSAMRRQHADILGDIWDSTHLMPPKSGPDIVDRLSAFLERHGDHSTSSSSASPTDRKKTLS